MARGLTFSESRTHRFYIEDCCACGVEFALTEQYYNERVKDHKLFYCPNGHSQHYTGKSDRERIAQLEAEKTALQARVNSERNARETAERARDRAKADKKRIETRVAKALCPYCNRSFADSRLARHIHTKHPEKAHE